MEINLSVIRPFGYAGGFQVYFQIASRMRRNIEQWAGVGLTVRIFGRPVKELFGQWLESPFAVLRPCRLQMYASLGWVEVGHSQRLKFAGP